MASSKELILRALEDLGAEDFKKFKWYLQQSEVLEGFPAIPKSRLESADRLDTVDQMVQPYSIDTVQVTNMVLVKMNKNDVAKKLSKTTSDPTGRRQTNVSSENSGPAKLPDFKDAEDVQKFFLEEIKLGEELLAQDELEKGVDHLTNAVAVCAQPQQLLEVYRETLPPPVFQMLLTKLPTITQRLNSNRR